MAKNDWSNAEKAAEHYLREVYLCEHTRRPVRTRFQKQDFFACDVVGKTADGNHIYAQVTTGDSSAVAARRRKIEAIPWHESDTVIILQMKSEKIGNKRRFWFRIHHYETDLCGWNALLTGHEIPREWFKPFKDSPLP